jgi:hypothetical protein
MIMRIWELYRQYGGIPTYVLLSKYSTLMPVIQLTAKLAVNASDSKVTTFRLA